AGGHGTLIVQAADGSYRNRLLWAQPDGQVRHYDKRHLFRMAGEHEHFTPGDEQVVFEVKGWRVRPLICYDLRFPVWSRDPRGSAGRSRSEEHTSELQSREKLVCRLLLEKKKEDSEK